MDIQSLRVQAQDAGSREGEARQRRRSGRRSRRRCGIAVPAAPDAALDGVRLHRVHGVAENTAAAVGKGGRSGEYTSRGT